MTKKNMSRRERMIAYAIYKINFYDLYLISGKDIGNDGKITNDMPYDELRYAASVLYNIKDGYNVSKKAEDYRLSKIHPVYGNVVILDKGSRKLTENLFINHKGNVFIVEKNGHTHYFNWKMSEYIKANLHKLKNVNYIEEIESEYAWDEICNLAFPKLNQGVKVLTWWWNKDKKEYYEKTKIMHDREDFKSHIKDMLNDTTADYITLVDTKDQYICTVDFMNGEYVAKYPYVSKCRHND